MTKKKKAEKRGLVLGSFTLGIFLIIEMLVEQGGWIVATLITALFVSLFMGMTMFRRGKRYH